MMSLTGLKPAWGEHGTLARNSYTVSLKQYSVLASLGMLHCTWHHDPGGRIHTGELGAIVALMIQSLG